MRNAFRFRDDRNAERSNMYIDADNNKLNAEKMAALMAAVTLTAIPSAEGLAAFLVFDHAPQGQSCRPQHQNTHKYSPESHIHHSFLHLSKTLTAPAAIIRYRTADSPGSVLERV